jgi:hypothetical protein
VDFFKARAFEKTDDVLNGSILIAERKICPDEHFIVKIDANKQVEAARIAREKGWL